MASVTVNSKGKVTNVTNGTKSNTNLSSKYSAGEKSGNSNNKNSSGSSLDNAILSGKTAYSEPTLNSSNVPQDTPVIGSMDGNNTLPVIGSSGGNSSLYTNYRANISDDEVKGLSQSIKKDTSENGQDTMGNLYGYADPEGYYTTRQTAYTWTQPDGTTKTTYSNATNYKQALDDAVSSGQVQSGSSLRGASTYGTGSLTGDGYNYGVTAGVDSGFSGFGGGSDGGRYTNDKQYSTMYDQNNMQLAYLSGRDGKDYLNPTGGLGIYDEGYTPQAQFDFSTYGNNSLDNAYNKGTGVAGQGSIMGDYGVGQSPMGSTLNTALNQSGGYQGLTADQIQSKMDKVYSNYKNSMEDYNDSLSAGYDYQKQQNAQSAENDNRALYLQKLMAEKNMPEQMASLGVNGGLTESTLTKLNSNYQNAYNQNQMNLSNVNSQLEIAKQQAISQNNVTLAQYYADIQQTTLQMQQSAYEAENNFNLSMAQMAQAKTESDRNYAFQVAQFEYEKTLQTYNNARDELQYQIQLASSIGDYDTVEKLSGLDTSYIKQMQELEYKTSLLSYNKNLLGYNKSLTTGRSSSGGDDDLGETYEPKITRKTGVVTSLGKYASGLYTDLAKSGYSPSQIDNYLTNEYNKGYITKSEAESLANKLIGA